MPSTRLTPGDREILAEFDRCRAVTIELLKRIPPAMLKRTAAGEEVPLGLLFQHIAAAVDGWMARCMKDGGPMPGPRPARPPARAAIVRSLEASKLRLLVFFRSRGGAPMSAIYRSERGGKSYRFTGRDRVTYLTQHEVHHRGKIVLALRQWGFTKIPFIPFAID
jgi:uncharacterized damage-inducible protein DinB